MALLDIVGDPVFLIPSLKKHLEGLTFTKNQL